MRTGSTVWLCLLTSSYLKVGLRATDQTLSYMGIVVLGKLEVKDQTWKNQKRHNLGKMGQTIIFTEVAIGAGH